MPAERRGPVGVLAGPTASGKTELSLRLAERLGAEVVMADAFCVYRGMDIGTAKPTREARAQVPHHCLDIVDPVEEFSAADFQNHARAALNDVQHRGRFPLLVGGSGLYLRAATDDIEFGGRPDAARRLELEAMPAGDLVGLLERLAPDRAARTDLANPRRVLRQVEQALDGVAPPDAGWTGRSSGFDVRFAVVAPADRSRLYRRIDTRIDTMLTSGWLDEVAHLGREYGELSKTARAAIGYAELHLVLQGEMEMSEAIECVRRRTRAFARRQLTWFRREPRAHWFDPEAECDADVTDRLTEFLSEGGT